MRGVLLGLVLGAALLRAPAANADSYSYGGRGERFQLRVWLLGFNEGAGTDGWTTHSAREFAEWASRFDAITPKGAFVSLDRDINDDKTTLTIRVGKRKERHQIDGEPGYEEALRVVAKRFDKKPPPARRHRIYTLQLFASKSEASARRFAEKLDSRQVEVDGQLYYEACHPCSLRESKVLEAPGGMYRVITGVFGDRARAGRELAALKKRYKLAGFVREL